MRSHQDLSYVVHSAWASLRGHISGLSDQEFAWEPAPGSRSLGGLIVHLAATKEMHWEYAYGPAQLTWEHVNPPASAANALLWLERGQELIEGALKSEKNLSRPLLTSWGETWPAWRVFWSLAEHDLEHGGEIRALRAIRKGRSQSR